MLVIYVKSRFFKIILVLERTFGNVIALVKKCLDGNDTLIFKGSCHLKTWFC